MTTTTTTTTTTTMTIKPTTTTPDILSMAWSFSTKALTFEGGRELEAVVVAIVFVVVAVILKVRLLSLIITSFLLLL